MSAPAVHGLTRVAMLVALLTAATVVSVPPSPSRGQPVGGETGQCEVRELRPPPPPAPLVILNLYHAATPPPPRLPVLDQCKARMMQSRACGSPPGINPIAETVHMRLGRGVELSESARRRFAAATIAQDFDTASRLMAPELTSDNRTTVWAARLALAYAAVRDVGPGSEIARDAIAALGTVSDGPQWQRSDWHYLTALRLDAAGQQKRAKAALTEAVAAEPTFFAALTLLLRLVLEEEDRRTDSDGACTAYFRDLFSVAEAILDINPCPLPIAHLDRYLHVELGPPAGGRAAARWAAKVYMAWVAGIPAAVENAQQEFRRSSMALPRQCRAMVDAELTALVGQ